MNNCTRRAGVTNISGYSLNHNYAKYKNRFKYVVSEENNYTTLTNTKIYKNSEFYYIKFYGSHDSSEYSHCDL